MNMRKNCDGFRDGLMQIAFGGSDADAMRHVETCADCQVRLAEYRKMAGAFSQSSYDAPKNLLDRAIGLMPDRRPRFRLVASTLAWNGARAVSEDFQLLVEAADVQIRLFFVRQPGSWQVMGRLPSEDWTVTGNVNLSEDRTRFSFVAPELESTAFSLSHAGGTYLVPSAEELLRDGPGPSH